MDDLPDISSFLSKYKERIQAQQEDIQRLKTELAAAVKERDSFKSSCEQSFLMNRESIEHLLTKLQLMVDNSRVFEGKEQQRAKMTEGVGTIVDVVQQLQQQQPPPSPSKRVEGALVMPESLPSLVVEPAAAAAAAASVLSFRGGEEGMMVGEEEIKPGQTTEQHTEVHIVATKKKRGGKKKKKHEEETDEFGQTMEAQEEVFMSPPSSPGHAKMVEVERRTVAVAGEPAGGKAGNVDVMDEYINAAFAQMESGFEGERSRSPGVTVYPESPRVVSMTKVTTNVPALAAAIEQRQAGAGSSEEKATRLLLESKKEKQQMGGGGGSSSPRIEELTGVEEAALAEGSPRITPQMITPSKEQESNPWQVVAPNILETIVSGLELKDVSGEAFV